MLKLLIQDDEGRKTLVPFSRDEITIGREDGNTIRLTERNVSRRHARLFRHSAQIFIEDLKSHNGIHLNGRRVRGQAVVRQGDTIAIGDYDIVLEGNISTPPPPPQKTPEAPVPAPPLPPVLQVHPPMEHPPAPPGMPAPPPPAPEEALPPPVDFAASVVFSNTLDLAAEAPREASAFKSAVTFKSPASSRGVDTVRDAPKAPAPPKDFAAFVASRQTLDLSGERVQGERPTVRLPEFTELPESESPRLVALNLELRGREFLCSRSEFSLGHSNINDLILKHSSIAPIHCRIERNERGRWFLAVDARHPVLVNGEPYRHLPLAHGDILKVGKQELQFFLPYAQTARVVAAKKKPAPSKLLPFGIGLLLAFVVVLGFLYLYGSTGALHESSSPPLRSLAHRLFPRPPPPQQPAPPQPLPPPAPPAVQPEVVTLTTLPPAEELPTPLTLAQAQTLPPPSEANTLNKADSRLHAASSLSPKLPEKTAGRSPVKTTLPPVRPPGKSPTPPTPPTRETKPGAPSPPVVVQPPEVETPGPVGDMDLFWEDVYLLQKKAERELTVPAKRATLLSLHEKLLTCNTARCAYELAKTSFLLANLGNVPAKVRFPDEFEAYLNMRDTGRQASLRREDACNILLSHYNRAENSAKVQALSELCTR